jgi:hypothetical protein
MGFYRLANLPKNLVGRIAAGVHLNYPAPGGPVEIQHRPRLPVVRIQTPANYRLAVIVPDPEFLAIQVAQPIHLRRLGGYIIQRAAEGTLAASSQTGDNNIVINGEMNYHLTDPPLVQPHRQMAGLVQRARVTVQNKSVRRIGLRKPLLHHQVYHVILHQGAGVHAVNHGRV